MSFPITPSKRPFDRNPLEPNGRAKWQKTAAFHSKNQPLKISPGSTVFRVLCPASKSGNVIGKGGSVVMQIRQETGAKVKVEETIPGCDERVIMITGSDKDAEMSNDQNKDDDENNTADDDGDDNKETDENNEDKESPPLEVLQSGKVTSSSAQRALLLVFERIVEGDSDTDGGEEAAKKPSSSVFVRLLVLSTQVGCLLGKGGSVIKQMAAESGAQIRILPRDKLPSCASPSDELVQITGELDAVRKALQSVSQQLLENPPRDRDSFPASKPTGPSSHRFVPLPQAELYPPANYHFPVQPTPYSAGPHLVPDYHPRVALSTPKFHENVLSGQMNAVEEILTFRLLCMNEKIGGVIGKGGSIIKTLQQETGSDIKILDAVPESDDRIIVISAPAHPDDRISAAQEAVLRMQSRVVSPVPDSPDKVLSSRLLVPSNHIGCLLGKGGAIIAEMRKLSGAHIRILGKDRIPKCASDNEEVVQVIGEFEAVQEAMLQITLRLRQHLFRDKFPAMNHLPHLDFPDQLPPPFAPYMGRRDPSPPRIYPGLGPSFHKFDVVGGFPPRDERSAFAHGIHKPGFPPHSSERMPSSAPWAPQGISDGGGPIGVPDYAGGPQRRIGGFGGSQSAVITSTTVEVVVPRSVVPSIYGEDGGCLKQIRQISGAKITINEPRPGATETAITISGTPEQTHAAQSLLQAFVLSEQGTP
ncbi:RNA-binding KH domain-containing protein RCF3-like isoform X2 [Magnolia sinica]|uniref:RNA-binding KH domain-containing protein RCF3-like isoform X2 n=1 Tax=Magnolia sinica TaxID=86752 RepID=UPI0026582905|nr:RNA-binding KH domain-containing protein RCF3-like isoform X2 [Magnolia sinica]